MPRRCTLALVLGALLAAGEARAAGISLSTSGFSFTLGQTIPVSLFAVGFSQGTAPAIRSYSITINFDPALVEATSISFGTQLDPQSLGSVKAPVIGSGFATADEAANAATTAAALNAAQLDTFVLATVNLRALATGTGIITGVVDGVRNGDDQLFTSLDSPFPLSFQVVPEPGTRALLGFGALGLAAAARVRRRRARPPARRTGL